MHAYKQDIYLLQKLSWKQEEFKFHLNIFIFANIK